MKPAEQAEQLFAIIKMMQPEAVRQLAWLLHEQSETARDRLGNKVCRMFEMSGGMFRVVHESERERMVASFQDETRRLHGVREELIPPAAIGARVRDGGKRGHERGGDQSKRDSVRAEWHRIQRDTPGTPIQETRRQIKEAGIAAMSTIKEHTKDLAEAMKKVFSKKRKKK